jgi:hypothetical protein
MNCKSCDIGGRPIDTPFLHPGNNYSQQMHSRVTSRITLSTFEELMRIAIRRRDQSAS